MKSKQKNSKNQSNKSIDNKIHKMSKNKSLRKN